MRNRHHQLRAILTLVGTASIFAVTIGTLTAYALTGERGPRQAGQDKVLRGTGAVGDWTNDAPGVRHLVRLSDLPAPYATPSSGNNPRVAPWPENAPLK